MQRRAFLLLFAAATLGSATLARAEPRAADLKKLTIDQVAAKLRAPKTFVFDANSHEMFVAGHVPGAKWVDEDNVTAAALGPDKTAMMIFYCHDEG
ncbi:MAG TPA: rhodanese-like domain-containing protein [Kofleriaceae bacterium]